MGIYAKIVLKHSMDLSQISNGGSTNLNYLNENAVENESFDNIETESLDEQKWTLSVLLKTFGRQDLDELYAYYTDKINHGYYSLYLILQFLLSLTHFFVVFYSVYYNKEYLMNDLPDLIFYLIASFSAFIGLFAVDIIVRRTKRWKYIQICWFFLIFIMNFFVPLYHCYCSELGKFRPAYSSLLVISCYVFYNVFNNKLALVSGMFVSLAHILTMLFVTYADSPKTWQRILSDILFQICINGLGIYFRMISEIIKRRSFLDRRECVVSTFELTHEKNQQDRLLLSIIPHNILEKVKEESNIEKNYRKSDNIFSFSNKSLQSYENVTILFADIVNYTAMTKKLNIQELLITLNDLFCSFDDASDKHEVTRIKFLGDCYYCVSGLMPSPNRNHGEDCVDLGLEMIQIIAKVRHKRDLNVNMRIGIHSGTLIGGIIGKVKIQFDIWSDDVNLANIMETEGEAGQVHITQQTKDLLQKDYNIKKNEREIPYFINRNIETYLVSPEEDTDLSDTARRQSKFIKRSEPPILLDQLARISKEEIYEEEETDISNNNEKRLTIIELNNMFSDTPQDETTKHDRSPIIERSEMSSNKDLQLDPTALDGYSRRQSTYLKKNERPILLHQLQKTQVTDEEDIIESDNGTRTSQKSVTFNDSNNHGPISIKSNGSVMGNKVREVGAVRRLTHNLNRRPPNARLSEERRITGEQRRTAFMRYNKKRFDERQIEVNKEMYNEIGKMTFSKYEQFVKNKDITGLMFFRNKQDEFNYIRQFDPLFKYYIISELILLICVYLIQNLTLSSWDFSGWSFYLAMGIILVILIPLTWTHYLWNQFAIVKPPKNTYLKLLYDCSRFIVQNFVARHCIYILTCLLFSYCVLSEVVECSETINNEITESKHYLIHLVFLRRYQEPTINIQCAIPWHMTETCALAIIMTFIFLKIFIWLKLFLALTISGVYAYCVLSFTDEYYENTDTFNYNLKPQIAHIIGLIFLMFTLHLIDRQTDYMNRQDFLWNKKLRQQQKIAHEFQTVNKSILTNILPEHVANLYLDVSKKDEELYADYHKNVAVMFATIIYENIEETSEKNFLDLMNVYICEFDKITLREEFKKSIEKIKIAKWTYMVACGLVEENIEIHASQHVEPITTLIKFASEMMKKLHYCNDTQQQQFKLRIGISHGLVAAGVVGSKKPLYDIWGDPVNMASRMDSTGVANKIQVLQETAVAIKEQGFCCEYRKKTKVKGFGGDGFVDTYFVSLDDNHNLIPIKNIV